MKSAYDVKALETMGIDISSLGCVMLGVEPINLSDVIDPEWAYVSPDPDRFWIDGITKNTHVTLLYGLLQPAHAIESAIDEVLEGWEKPERVEMDMLDVFPSPFEDEPYSCIVARQTRPQQALLEAHQRLSLLPHINTYPTYKAHVTLAYVHRDHMVKAVSALQQEFGNGALNARFQFWSTELDLGGDRAEG